MKTSFVSFDDFSHDRVLVDRDGIKQINPHRFEMLLLDGILFNNEQNSVGFIDVTSEMFWVRGHFPGRPLMPGVLMCECAAQLSAYFAITNNLVDEGVVGLGGLEGVRFRGPVVPGDRLTVMLNRGKVRRNVMFSAEFQGFVGKTLVVDGTIKGVALG